MIVLISRGYVTRRAGIARTLAAVAASTLLAGCGVGGGGSTTPSPSASASATSVVSDAGASVAEQPGSESSGAGTTVAGSVSNGATGKVTGGSVGTFTHSATPTFSVSHSQVTQGSPSSLVTTPAQAKKPADHGSKTTTSSGKRSTPASTGTTQPTQDQAPPPKTEVQVVTRYRVKVDTVYRNRTITKTITKTVAPKLPAGAFLLSKHPQLGQRAFTITGTNVGCELDQAGVRCGIKNRDWTAPVQPSSCRSSWGFTIVLASLGLPKFACGGRSPINPSAKVIPAGWDDHVGNYICEVRSFGVNCFNSKSHGGFLFGRTGYTLY